MNDNLPFVSAIMPTYNRFPSYGHLLEEAVESFRRQTYPVDRRELIILNDTPDQQLICDVKGVKVLNFEARLPSLGAKYNAAIQVSRGSIVLPWEDDDISLPQRITQAVEILGDKLDYFNPQRSWYMEGANLHCDHSHGVCHNASAFTRKAWEHVGGYPHISGAQDASMDRLLKSRVRTAISLFDVPSSWQYIYRWGVSNCHLSGTPSHEKFWETVGKWPVMPGTFTITPRWKLDYSAMCAEAASRATVAPSVS